MSITATLQPLNMRWHTKCKTFFVEFVKDPLNAVVNLPKMGWPIDVVAAGDEVLLFGADGKVRQIENGALNQTLCAFVVEYEVAARDVDVERLDFGTGG
jgi:hypothetical protein